MENNQDNTGWGKANLDKSLSEGSTDPNEDSRQHQDLSQENIGFEPEEKTKGDPDSPYKLKQTLDDKRPEDDNIEKGWSVDSDTSR